MQIIKPEDIKIGSRLMTPGNKAINSRDFHDCLLIVKNVDLPFIAVDPVSSFWLRYKEDADRIKLLNINEHDFYEPSMGFIDTVFGGLLNELEAEEGENSTIPPWDKKDTIEVTAELHNWGLTVGKGMEGWYLSGNIYHDSKKRFEDGRHVTTSAIKYVDLTAGLVKTENSVYRLINV